MFVLLEHDTGEGVHWDFIIEVPGRELLPTWRLLKNPLTCRDAIPAQPIADHQPHFLEYEGQLSAGRGRVRRVDRGEAFVEQSDGRGLVAELVGGHLHCRMEIVTDREGQTRFRRLEQSDWRRFW